MISNSTEKVEYLNRLAVQSRAITSEIAEICFYMRGSITWDQAWRLTSKQKDIIRKLIKDNIDRTEKSGMPLL